MSAIVHRYQRLRGLSLAARYRREVELLAREARTWAVASVGQAVLAVGLVVLGLAHSPAWWALAWVAGFGAALTVSRWRFCRDLRRGYAQHLRELRRAAFNSKNDGSRERLWCSPACLTVEPAQRGLELHAEAL